jgi:A/G-specific adenine glycosylase
METAKLKDKNLGAFRTDLLTWFAQNARDLPWRRTRDPYKIWVSEVMLQQTRVAVVIGRYTNFIDRFPSLVSLALANEEDVLAVWSGLGYYRRARLLHHAARLLVREHDGTLPKSSVELRRLPGVGDYTAAAIASIAHGEAIAVVDGNVERVLIRLFGKGAGDRRLSASRLKLAATRLLDAAVPGAFNQAIMELGATVCLPRAPLCSACPVQPYCRTCGEHLAQSRKQMLSEKVAYAVVKKPLEGSTSVVSVLLVQRTKNAALMPGMWELPVVSSPAADWEPILRVRHSITNTNYYVSVYDVQEEETLALEEATPFVWKSSRELGEIPLTGLARKILMRLGIFARPKEVRQGKALPGAESVFL